MLFVLTGNVQTGKTRWLEHVIESLESQGIAVFGVLAPGVWADRRGMGRPNPNVDANGFEKLGIDNVLLPSHERLTFARRADIALEENLFDPHAQSAQAKLSWHISDDAIECVNGHFSSLLASRDAKADLQPEDAATKPGVLVVDELGRLELERGGGLTMALAVLDAGPTGSYAHAIVVVRESLLPFLDGRFESWGERALIAPNDESLEAVLACASSPRNRPVRDTDAGQLTNRAPEDA